MIKKLLSIVMVLGLMVGGAAAMGVWALYRATQQTPDFYEAALTQKAEQHVQASEELERRMQHLQQQVQRDGQWEAIFTDEQINGWLALAMPPELAQTLPQGVEDPRVAIGSEKVRIACRFDNGRFKSIISLVLRLELTDEPNVVAVRVLEARAGALPLPVKQFLNHITRRASEADLTVRWLQHSKEPVALVTVPAEHERYRYRAVQLEALELRDGEILLAGRTGDDILPAAHRTAEIEWWQLVLR